ncbi:MAG: pyrroline-5-carboxylate reductase [Acetobacteraceae bacterium]
MTAPLPPLLLVGCGRMGGAMLAAWLEQGLARSVVVDPAPRLPPDAAAAITVTDAGQIPAGFAPEAVVFAVKPQQADAVLPEFARFASSSVFLSIMAGRTLASLQARLGPGAGHTAAIVRAMPNTPAAIRAGTTVACAGPGVGDARKALCERLLAAVGRVAWVADESLLDPVTAVSGSGPAYVFLLAELLERAGIEQGLPADLARLLARRTVSGAGALLAASEEDAAALRRAVTSPGGTTERALAVLMDESAWPGTLSRAIAAATHRSRELAG